jgi:putative selenium metabolism hydrolase
VEVVIVTAKLLKMDKHGLIDFTQKIIQIPSTSLEEEKVARVIAEKMKQVGFEDVTVDSLFNVVGYLYAEDREPELLFNGHIDTVPPGEMPHPYSGEIVDGSKYGVSGSVIEGRGACDMKGAVASMIYAGKAIRESGLRLKKTFVMTATSREEPALGEGINYMFKEGGVRAKMAVSGEATNLQTHLGHRGKTEFNIRVLGKTAHASNPGRGINAVYKMSGLIQDLIANYKVPSHPVLGDCTFTIIDIASGPGRIGPITPDWCEIIIDRRYLPEESAASVQQEIESLITRRKDQDPDLHVTVELVKDFVPFYCREDEPIVSIIQDARQVILGDPGKLSVWKFGIEGPFLEQVGIPCAGFGPGSEEFAHTPDEHVPIEDLHISCQVYAEMIRRVCGS